MVYLSDRLVKIKDFANFHSNFQSMRSLAVLFVLAGFGLFLTGETWLWSKKMADSEEIVSIDYVISGDSLRVKVPISIPYLQDSFESQSKEKIVVVEDAYFLITRTYFSGDTLHTVGHRIQPDRQAMFSILGKLIQLQQDTEPSPIDKALDLFKQLAKFYFNSTFHWIQWFWLDWVPTWVPFFSFYWEALPLSIPSPPPCQVS